MAEQEKASKTETATKYTKEQFISSLKYLQHRDILDALLKDGKTYTSEDVDKVIKDFMEEGK